MDIATFKHSSKSADRELKRKWAIPMLAPALLFCATYLLWQKTQLFTDLAAKITIAGLLGFAGVICILYFRDHQITARRLGLQCPKCGASLFNYRSMKTEETGRCWKCDEQVVEM